MKGKSGLAAALAALALSGAFAPARAAIDAFGTLELPRMTPRTAPLVVVRDGALTICTDGVVRDKKRSSRLRRKDSTRRGATALTAGGRALDPDRIPYFVLPRGFSSAGLGDLALVTYNGRSAWAVAGDKGPCEGCVVGKKHPHPYLFGEGSTALARLLGVPGADNGDGGGVPAGVTFLIFPGTAPKQPFRSVSELERHIDETGAARFAPRRRERLALLAP